MDSARALALVGSYLEALATHRRLTERVDGFEDDALWREADEDVRRLSFFAERLAEQIAPQIITVFEQPQAPPAWRWERAAEGALRLKALLELGAEADEILGVGGPTLQARGLHPWIWEPAALLWRNGHYREAVQAASTQLELQLQAKLGNTRLTGTDLATQAFRLTTGRSTGVSRLVIGGGGLDGETWRCAQEGAMHFARGCFLGIRNVVTHSLEPLEEGVALEALASLSLLARWAEAATVIED